jgi:hypothetical protein
VANRRDERKNTVASRFARKESNREVAAILQRSTRSDLEEILFGLDEERGPDAEFVQQTSQGCTSVLEAICHAFHLMKPRRARLSRMRDLVGLITSSYDQGLVRLIVAPQLFLTFELEEEALTFYIFTMQKLDVQQVVANFDALQDQSQRCIRLHSNPLFACLRITAAVCTICRRGGMMREIWAEEHGRLKKIAVQIFEMLPQSAFDKIFENTGIQHMFLELAIQKAECLDMLDIPRFKDYLHTRWDGVLQLPEEVHDADDYFAYWDRLFRPRTLIFSPRVRFIFRALCFVVFTVICQTLSKDFVEQCHLELSPTHVLLWLCVLGHILHECIDFRQTGLVYFRSVWKLNRAFLVVLYLCFFAHCMPFCPSFGPGASTVFWGFTLFF